MVDYADRYDDFAQYAAAQGYYVVANDHLGHGASVVTDDQHGYFGHPNGNECVIADIHTLRTMTQKKYPDLPYFFLGHSMGSFLTRQYIQMHADGLAGAVIMGTGSQPRHCVTYRKAALPTDRAVSRMGIPKFLCR